jgi:hypothetical protein
MALRRPLVIGLLMIACPAARAAAGGLSSPGDYSFAPSGPSGVVSTSVGSGGSHGSSIALDSGLLDGRSRAFVEVDSGQASTWRNGPRLDRSGVAIGATTVLPGQSELTLEVGASRDTWSVRGR